MSANLKCYDSITGQVLFDMQSHTTRFLGIIDGDSTNGTISIEKEGGTLFWTLASGGVWAYQNHTASGGFIINNSTNDDIKITDHSGSFTYKKPKGVVIIYGVYV